jgi:hypothetical protein
MLLALALAVPVASYQHAAISRLSDKITRFLEQFW